MLVVPSVLVYILVPLFYVVIPTTLILTVQSNKALKIIHTILAVLFFALLFVATTFEIHYNSTQVKIIFEYRGVSCGRPIHWSAFPRGMRDFLINISMLIPMGAIICMNTKDKLINRIVWAVVFGIITGVVIETLQYLLPVARTIQLSDVLLNMFSTVAGTLYYHLIYTLRKKRLTKNE